MNATSIETVVQREVWSVGPDVTMAAIEKEMVERRLTWVPIAEPGGSPLGVVSAWDLLRFHAEGKAPDTAAWQLCTYRPLVVRPNATVAEAAALMRDAHIHHMMVVAADGRLVGVVSSLDLLQALEDRSAQ